MSFLCASFGHDSSAGDASCRELISKIPDVTCFPSVSHFLEDIRFIRWANGTSTVCYEEHRERLLGIGHRSWIYKSTISRSFASFILYCDSYRELKSSLTELVHNCTSDQQFMTEFNLFNFRNLTKWFKARDRNMKYVDSHELFDQSRHLLNYENMIIKPLFELDGLIIPSYFRHAVLAYFVKTIEWLQQECAWPLSIPLINSLERPLLELIIFWIKISEAVACVIAYLPFFFWSIYHEWPNDDQRMSVTLWSYDISIPIIVLWGVCWMFIESMYNVEDLDWTKIFNVEDYLGFDQKDGSLGENGGFGDLSDSQFSFLGYDLDMPVGYNPESIFSPFKDTNTSAIDEESLRSLLETSSPLRLSNVIETTSDLAHSPIEASTSRTGSNAATLRTKLVSVTNEHVAREIAKPLDTHGGVIQHVARLTEEANISTVTSSGDVSPSQSDAPVEIYKCEEHSIETTNRREFGQHMFSLHGIKLFACPNCDRAWARHDNMEKHRRTCESAVRKTNRQDKTSNGPAVKRKRVTIQNLHSDTSPSTTPVIPPHKSAVPSSSRSLSPSLYSPPSLTAKRCRVVPNAIDALPISSTSNEGRASQSETSLLARIAQLEKENSKLKDDLEEVQSNSDIWYREVKRLRQELKGKQQSPEQNA